MGPSRAVLCFLYQMKNFPSLKKNNDFRAVYKSGSSKATPSIVMYVLNNKEGKNRLGVSASRKYGNSVERHRFARRMREVFRYYQDVTKQGYDIVIVARNKAKHISFSSLCGDYEKLLLSHNILMDRSE